MKMERQYTRYAFSADVDIVDSLGIKIRTRTKKISYGGCCVIANGVCFRPGTGVTLRIHEGEFEATGTIIYADAQEMGVMFRSVPPPSLLVLRKWIDGAG